jgi:hypothetical protein
MICTSCACEVYMLIMGAGDTGLWRLRRTDCRRRLRATWIRYVVSLDTDMWGLCMWHCANDDSYDCVANAHCRDD